MFIIFQIVTVHVHSYIFNIIGNLIKISPTVTGIHTVMAMQREVEKTAVHIGPVISLYSCRASRPYQVS